MSGIVRWKPSSRLPHPAFGSLVSRFFDDALDRNFEEDSAVAAWTPSADVKETDSALFVYVELPGLNKEDIEVSVESNVLTVSGERRFTQGETQEIYHRRERFFGQFSRSFRLPRNVDSSSVAATFNEGLLTLELPKKEEAKPRQIAIH